MKVDAHKISEIARKLGVSERTVEEYLLDRLTMQDPHKAQSTMLIGSNDDRAFPSTADRAHARTEARDRFEERRKEELG